MKYAILMQHGVDLHSCPGTLADVHDRVESMPCASSTKTQPDSRGTSPAMTKMSIGYYGVSTARPTSRPFCRSTSASLALERGIGGTGMGGTFLARRRAG